MRLAAKTSSLGLLWIAALTGCYEHSRNHDAAEAAAPPDASQHDAAQDGGDAIDAAATDAGFARDAGAPAFDLSVPVVMREGQRYVPGFHALVRIDDAHGHTWQTVAPSDGIAHFALDPETAPWDITVADPGRGAISVLGVTGPLEAPVHLPASIWHPDRTQTSASVLRGAIIGRANDNATRVQLYAPALESFTDHGSTYQAVLDDRMPATLVDAIAVESAGDAAEPAINAARVQFDPVHDDPEHVDIVFPSPTPGQRLWSMTVRIPMDGRLSMLDLNQPGVAYVRLGSVQVPLGSSTPMPSVPGEIDWSVTAAASDVVPEWAALDLIDADSGDEVLVTASVTDGAVVDVQAYERLEFSFAEDGSPQVEWDASAYPHVGASFQAIAPAPPTGWFVYTYGPAPLGAQRWPQLPGDMTLRDLGLSGTIRVNVFAYDTFSVPIWNWAATEAEIAVISSSDHEVEPE
jgi:hypothetical protein